MSAVLDNVSTFRSQALPSGWRAVTLEDIVADGGVFVDGDWVESKDQDPEGDVRLIQLADVGEGEYRDRSERFLNSAKASELGCTFLEPGDLLIARMPDPLGRACVFPGDRKRAVTVVDVAVVRPRNPELNTRWLMYCINAPQFRRVVASLQSGSTRQRISRKNLAKIVFPLPPRRWQDEVVAELEKHFSRLDEAVANLKRVKANLKRYKAAVLKAAVEGRLVPTEAELACRDGRRYESGQELLKRILGIRRSRWKGKGTLKDPPPPDTADLPALPAGWCWARLDAVASIKGGITVDKKRRDPTLRSVPYLRVANVQRGHLDLREVKLIEAPAREIEELRLLPGDVLFNEGGDRDKLGRGWVWEGQLAECIHQNHVFRARPFTSDVAGKLVSWWGNTFGKDYFVREGKQTTNLASINMRKLSALPVPIPPTVEQRRITSEVERRLSAVDEIERQVDANLQRAAIARNSALNRLLGSAR